MNVVRLAIADERAFRTMTVVRHFNLHHLVRAVVVPDRLEYEEAMPWMVRLLGY